MLKIKDVKLLCITIYTTQSYKEVLAELEKDVNDLCNNGYRPSGELIVMPITSIAHGVVAQKMILYEDEPIGENVEEPAMLDLVEI